MGEGNHYVSMANWNRVKVLGQGSYGVVYLALPTIGDSDFFALKVALLERSSSLIREKEILEHFNGCPEIIQCIRGEICFHGNSLRPMFYNLVLEYAAGGTLADLIMQRGMLPESEVKEYLRMILRGLSCIHDRGFVHGDLKPANILVFLENDGKIKLKIADFGLSRRRDECKEVVECSNAKPKFRGTPKYMSPESVVFGKIDAPLDIWSLGCILVEMISGNSVWSECRSRRQVMKKLVHEMQIPNIPEELSREGRDFLAGCFDQNCERRWTADQLLGHPYIQQEQRVDEMPSTWNLSDSLETLDELEHEHPYLEEEQMKFVEEWVKEDKDFHGSCFELNPKDFKFREKKKAKKKAKKKGRKKDDEIPLILPQDDELYKIADLIGFHDFVL